MKLPRTAFVVLFLFITGLVSATAGEVWHALKSADHMSHPEGSPCPDPSDDGGPCGPTCPCACCPGHAPATLFTPAGSSVEALLSGELETSLQDDLHPKEVLHRIFRPPRA